MHNYIKVARRFFRSHVHVIAELLYASGLRITEARGRKVVMAGYGREHGDTLFDANKARVSFVDKDDLKRSLDACPDSPELLPEA